MNKNSVLKYVQVLGTYILGSMVTITIVRSYMYMKKKIVVNK